MTDTLREQLRQAYDSNVEERNRRTLPEWKLNARATILNHLKKHDLCELIEIGAGTGRDAAFFAEEGIRMTCIDLSPEMVRCCQQKGLNARVMDVARLEFPDASFDAAYSINCLLHVPNDELSAVLAEIHRVLHPGGFFYYGTWGGFDQEGVFADDHLDPPRLFSFRSDEMLQQMVRVHFEILEFSSVERNPQDPKFRFQSLLLRQRK